MARRGGARHARVTSLARLGGGNGAVEQNAAELQALRAW